jgi:uncharacterized protein YfkK (UPF0435 family)
MSYEDIDQMIEEIVERDMVSVTLFEALSFIAASYKVKYSLLTEEELKKKYLSIRGDLH